ncbi:MAG: lantibiotic dehydratase [Geothrix sp.]|nr:lantibiotic dehydratase [Geothrix sp.]
MPHEPTCQTADFFVLRTPGLPLDALSPRDQTGPEAAAGDPSGSHLETGREALRPILREIIRRDAVREALALASPDLASRLGAWLDGSLDTPAAQNVERALLKYLSRMSSRSTPFGLFAGVSMGAWGSASHLSVGPWLACRKAMRLDWGVLEALVDRLEREPEVRALMIYRPNTSLYARGGWYRYLERREQAKGQGRTYHLEAVEATPHLDFVLRQAEGGARLGDLATSLADHMKVAPQEARSYLDQIMDAQVLCGDLQPPLTSPDPLGQVITALQADPVTAPRAEPLVALDRELKTLQGAPLGSHPEGYGSRWAPLAGLGISADTRDVLQADLFRPSPDLALSAAVRRALEEGAETLRRLTPVPAESPLDRFRAAFQERYGTRWMPLLEVLDEESGLGFDGGAPLDSPLLEGLSFPSSPPQRPLSHREKYLLKQLPRWQGSLPWALTDADVAALAHPDPPPFPQAFAALASLEASSLAALDRGDFHFWMEHFSGPTAARWLGRFASGDPALKAALQGHLRKEESLRPEAVFAEVVHVPEGRAGNVLARPALRDYEIPFLATPGVAPDHTILPSDLQLTVRGDRVVLASTRLGREVIPRLSSAHNFARGPVVYRFLAHLQDQDGRPGGWSWGALAEQPFLPRVTRGRHLLSKARWRLDASELKAAMTGSREGAWGAFQALRASRGLPRFVVLTDADNGLLVDLDQVLWVETLHHLVSGRSTFTLTECFPDPGQALVTSPEGRFAHELVIPFEAMTPAQRKAIALPSMSMAPIARAYPPGSEWLYLKLYCGPASADRLLVELAPLLRATGAEGLWDRWHFIRYQDPDHHLRLRFHGLPQRLLAELLPRIHQHLETHLAQGLLWKWQVDTFEPEWERYGGPLGFALAEAWFFADSQQILDQLVEGLTLEQRWRAGLRQTDAIWAALGLGVQARKGLAQAAREGFRKEFADSGEGAVQMGAKFRDLRKELASGFPQAPGAPLAPDLGGLTRIREAHEQGLLQEDFASLAGSLSHMHLNRLLRTDHRESEWVLMEFLTRLYESHLARFPEL